MALKETLFEPVHSVSHNMFLAICRFLRVASPSAVRDEITGTLRKESEAWEELSAKTLENFEKRFG